jgi:hypothetical protein
MTSSRPAATIPLVITAVIAVALITWWARPDDPTSGPESELAEGSGPAGDDPAGPGARAGRDPTGQRPPGPAGPPTVAPLLDPALVPGKPGVGVPPEVQAELDAAANLDPEWRDRHRSPDRSDGRPVVRPPSREREVGEPPNPQGAGIHAHEVWTGEPEQYEDVDDPAAVRESMRDALAGELAGLRGCFGSGAVPAMVVVIERIDDGRGPSGYVAQVDPAGGGVFPESVGDCLEDGLSELVLAAPPGARSVAIPVGP